jgi:hypothetical protein
MKYKFRCKASQQVYEFLEQDYEAMLQHPDYEEVLAEEVKEEAPKQRKSKGQ